jgi:hypothetical protein
MAWHSPYTWVDGDIPLGHGDHSDVAGVHSDSPDTTLSLNWQIRDNMEVLAVARTTSSGKFAGLASTYLADLDGTNLTGLAKLASENTYTAKNKYDATSGSGRVVLPVGADKFSIDSHTDHTDGAHTDTGVKTQGSFWVEGSDLHYVDQSNNEWLHAGVSVGTPAGAVNGSVWIEDNDIHYITDSGTERRVPGNTTSMHSDAAALGGSVWMEAHLHWIRESGTQEYDGSHSDSHSDVGHGDVAHSDSHTDNAHNDSHSDTAHADSHTDTAHSDSHADSHGDDALPHIDTHGDNHFDTAHADSHTDTGHTDSHTDNAHGDSHSDSHTDTAHSDSHNDIAPTSVGTWP